MKPTIKYKRNLHQKDFHDDDVSKFLHLSTGFGGGKTYSLVMKLLKLSVLNPNVDGGCVNPSIADFKKDVLPMFEAILDDNKIRYRYHRTDKWFLFPWSKGRLYIASAEKQIRGPNWGYAGINEVTLISKERYLETIGRVRVKRAAVPQIVSSGTPEGTSHWLYETFVERPMQNSRIIYGDTRDNLDNLNADYITSLEHSYDSRMLDAYLRGLWVNMTTNRFYYAYDPGKNDDKTLTQQPNQIVHVSMDFNVDPMTATLWHVFDVTGPRGMAQIDKWGRIERRLEGWGQIELTGPQGFDTRQMSAAMRARGLHPDTTIIYPDPAGTARSTKGKPDISILRDEGWHVRHQSKAPEFRRRQLAHNNLLDKFLIKIHPIECKGLKRDYESVEQDLVTLGKIKKNMKLTHYSDGVDYMIDNIFPFSGRKPNSGMVRIR